MKDRFCSTIAICVLAIGCGGTEPIAESARIAEPGPQQVVDAVESDGSTHGPAAGLEENQVSQPENPGESGPDGIVYVVDGTHYYHNESCRFIQNDERRILKDKRSMALISGYVACKVCKPDGPGNDE